MKPSDDVMGLPPTGYYPLIPWRDVASLAVSEHRAIQDANELAVALALASSIGPETVLEVGCYAGGTAWAWAQLPTVRTLIGIDSAPEADTYTVLAQLPQRTYHVGRDSGDPETLSDVQAILGRTPVDLLFIDGSHDLGSVTGDWRIYGPLVRTGGLVMFHDTQPHEGRPEVEVFKLWATLQRSYSTAEIVACPGQWAGIGVLWK